MPGAPVTMLPWGNRLAVFLADPLGGVFTAAGDPRTGWGPWASVSQGRTTPGAPVTAIPWRNGFAVFVADPLGEVFTAVGNPQVGFGPWASVSPKHQTLPGAPVTAITWGNQIALFVANPSGEVFTAVGDPQTGFLNWKTVSQGSTKPGAPITAIPWGSRIAVFLADPLGGIFMTGGYPQTGSFGPWASVSQFSSTPGAPIAAVPWGNGQALFVANPSGEVFSTVGDPQVGFAHWKSVAEGRTIPGGSITAALSARAPASISLFLADPNGRIFSITGDPSKSFGDWMSVSQFPPAPAAYQLGTLPPDPTPTIPDGDDIILYLHGGPGSRLEEAADLVGPLQVAGANLTPPKRYTVIAFDQPSQGYSSMLGPDQMVPPHSDVRGDIYPAVVFSDDFVVAFVNALDKVVPIKQRNIYIIGGSTGGALALRMGRRTDPSDSWIKRIVAWCPACVWHSYGPEDVKGAVTQSGFERSGHPEDDGSNYNDGRRKEFFDQAFGSPQVPWYVGVVAQHNVIQPNPEEWYRGDRDYYKSGETAPPAKTEWPCKWDYIAAARLDYEEIYNWRFRRWHWRFGTELLLFSFFNTSWEGPPDDADIKQSAVYWDITKPTMLVACEDDDWDTGSGYHWENRWSRVHELAPLMERTPGFALFVLNTGHSIHNERPMQFAQQIVAFLSDPQWDKATGPLQSRSLDPLTALDEDPNCRQKPSEISLYPRPPRELLQISGSDIRLLEPATLGGNFITKWGPGATDLLIQSPGTYGLRLIQPLRDVAAEGNPTVAIGNAAARYYLGDPTWGAFADLAVTGRAAYDSFRSHPPNDNDILANARSVVAVISKSSANEKKLAEALLAAKTRAYKVAWVLRDPDLAERFRVAPGLGLACRLCRG